MNAHLEKTMTASTSTVSSRQPKASLVLRERAFGKWLGNALGGERVEYHRGVLVIDREPRISTLAERHRQELVRIADRAMASAGEGLVLLLQERRGKDDFSYVAVMAKRKRTHVMTTNGAKGRAVAGAGA
jgi:hypothetical protein